ncbi:cell division protein CrgA [Angustibacter sp. McL0619]|uniref:cell division protein CrgA n=1 Tax=Angustibacter sp. McL0619 TaxID=3415676 RepID=UPI003CF65FAD
MPESRARKKATYTPPTTKSSASKQSASWYAPVMCALFLIGLAYIVVFYITQGKYPIEALGPWNVIVGFGVIMVGFVMATRWR